jgi:hypothetical protein
VNAGASCMSHMVEISVESEISPEWPGQARR